MNRREAASAFGIGAVLAASWFKIFTYVLNPATLYGGYNSDSAIPVLMCNDDSLRVESLYYWGQDRFSGTPFMLASLVHQVSGFFWSPSALAVFQVAWAMLSVFVMWRWSKCVAPALLWAGIVLIGHWHGVLFDISQPYGWQVTWLFLAAMVMTKQLDGGSWRGGVLLALLTWQTHAANAMSGTWLLALSVVEVLFAVGRRKRVALMVVLPLIAGIGLEAIVRGIVQVRFKVGHGFPVTTQMRLSLHDLDRFYGMMLAHFSAWHVAAIVGCAVMGIAWLKWHSMPRWLVYPAVWAVLNMLQPPLVKHIQDNDIAPRYFTVGALLAPWVMLAVLTVMLERVNRLLAYVPAAATIFFGPFREAAPIEDANYATNLATAQQLAKHAPESFLSSGYWDTYLLSSLVPRPALTPVPRDGQYQRSPHYYAAQSTSDQVWVGNSGSDGKPGREATIAFFPHVLLGKTLFVPQGETANVNGREFRRYRPAKTSFEKHQRLCPEESVTVPVEGTLVVMGNDQADYTTDAGEPSREGLGWLWNASGEVTVRSKACTYTRIFVTRE